MKKLTFIPLLALLITGTGLSQPCSDLFISEFSGFGPGNFTAHVELYNPTSSDIDLSTYTLKSFQSPGSSVFSFTPDGILKPGDTYTIGTNFANTPQLIKDKCDTLIPFMSALFNNGDDALALLKGNDTLDIIGQVGIDPGSFWAITGANGVSGNTRDHILVRNSSVQEGTTDWSLSSGQWLVFDPFVDTYMGFHEGTCFSNSIAVIINFDSTVADVNNGQYNGSGYMATPSSGQLDSDSWSVSGFSDGSVGFGGSQASGDFARGTTTGGVTTGGSYAIQVDAVANNDYGWGVQPGGSDFTPGELYLRVQNTSSATLHAVNIGYEVRVLNNAGRGNAFNFSYSTGGSFVNVSDFDFTSPTASDGSWVVEPMHTRIEGLSIAPGDYFLFRWTGDDVSGSGSRDEFVLDDIFITSVDTATSSSTCTADSIAQSIQICSGDSLLVGGQYQTLSGIYKDTLTNIGGCDSIIHTTLSVAAAITSTESLSICQGDSIMIDGIYQHTAGTYSYTLIAANGCDSAITATLSVSPIANTSTSLQICTGDSVLLEGQYQTTSGTYFDTLQTIIGCDSIISTSLTVVPLPSSNHNLSMCAGDSVFVGGQYQTSAGTYYDTLTSMMGCDSIVVSHLMINTTIPTVQNLSICPGDSIMIHGVYEHLANVYTDTISSTSGCDSISIVNLSLYPTATSPVIGSDQDSLYASTGYNTYQWYLDGNIITGATDSYYIATQSGTYMVEVSNSNGCFANGSIIHTFVGIDHILKGVLRIYPNPSHGDFVVEFPSGSKGQLEIIDGTGKMILRKTILSDKIEINGILSNGLYIIRYTYEGNQWSQLHTVQ